jgi:hypothetical protein
VGDRVRGAVADALDAGRAEMRARERRLRETLAAPDRSERRDGPGAGDARAVGR